MKVGDIYMKNNRILDTMIFAVFQLDRILIWQLYT